jgi:hypothetical protein
MLQQVTLAARISGCVDALYHLCIHETELVRNCKSGKALILRGTKGGRATGSGKKARGE